MKVEASTSFILDIEASDDGDGDDDGIDAYGEVDEEFFSQNPELEGVTVNGLAWLISKQEEKGAETKYRIVVKAQAD